MAIQVKVRGVDLAQREDGTSVLTLALTTTNDAYPDETLRMSLAYPVSLTAAQIQSQINEAVTLLWQAHGMPQWTV